MSDDFPPSQDDIVFSKVKQRFEDLKPAAFKEYQLAIAEAYHLFSQLHQQYRWPIDIKALPVEIKEHFPWDTQREDAVVTDEPSTTMPIASKSSPHDVALQHFEDKGHTIEVVSDLLNPDPEFRNQLILSLFPIRLDRPMQERFEGVLKRLDKARDGLRGELQKSADGFDKLHPAPQIEEGAGIQDICDTGSVATRCLIKWEKDAIVAARTPAQKTL